MRSAQQAGRSCALAVEKNLHQPALPTSGERTRKGKRNCEREGESKKELALARTIQRETERGFRV
eukprot:1379999-Rhodomonas_salina.1